MSTEDVDAYLAAFDAPRRVALEHLRRAIAAVIPDADQGLSYGVPVFRIDGRPIAGFSAAKNWISYLPHSGNLLAAIPDEDLEGFTASKGAIKIPVDQRLPDALVRKLVDARRAEAGV